MKFALKGTGKPLQGLEKYLNFMVHTAYIGITGIKLPV